MRTLVHPGPVHPRRIEWFRDVPRPLRYVLPAGATLNEALTRPLVEAGFQSATVVFRGASINPFRYVMPGPPDGPGHVAYFSAPRAPEGVTVIEQANATFGWADGKPSVHCHATWTEPDGSRRGGHILPGETTLAEAAEAEAWGFAGVRIEAAADAETNFRLFQPSGVSVADGAGVVARVKPNEDIVSAVEAICRDSGSGDAVIRGGLGSLIGARFADGGRVADLATEVLVRQGQVRDGVAEMELLVVDMKGAVHAGWLERGRNPVCITFDLVLEIVPHVSVVSLPGSAR